MRQQTSMFLVLAFSSVFSSQTGVDGVKLPELFTTHGSSVYIPCNVDKGTDEEHMTTISWSRIGHDGIFDTLVDHNEPEFNQPSNVELLPSRQNNFPSLVMSNMDQTMSGTYTCHTDKGSASTLVHVLDAVVTSSESQKSPKPSCSENFELVHGRCLYYSNEKKNWIDAFWDCAVRTSSLITFKDVKDLMSFLLNLQKSGPTNYQFTMWTGYSTSDESDSFIGPAHNDYQVSPMLYKSSDSLTTCGYLNTVERAAIISHTKENCNAWEYNFLCEQPTL